MEKFSCFVTFLKSFSHKQRTGSTVSKRATPYASPAPAGPSACLESSRGSSPTSLHGRSTNVTM